MPPPTAAVVKCSIELGNYIHLSNYVQKAETTPEAQVRCRLWCATCGGNQPSRVWLCIDSKPPVLREPAGNSA